MKIRKFAHLQAYARTLGIIVQRGKGREIETYHKDNHSVVGVTFSIGECLDELRDFVPDDKKTPARV
jgi:hypothetical protein